MTVAAYLMWYNYARFGSVFDFGANYNLTGNDMRYRGMHVARLLPGLWAFLFRPPVVTAEFPYLEPTLITTAYQGITMQELGIGGIFATNFILWPCFLVYRCRSKLREKKALVMAAICLGGGAVIACADVQMAGILTRYLGDFSIFLYIAAFLIVFVLLDSCDSKRIGEGAVSETFCYKTLAALCCVTLLYWSMAVFALYDNGDYLRQSPVWYYQMKELLGVFDV